MNRIMAVFALVLVPAGAWAQGAGRPGGMGNMGGMSMGKDGMGKEGMGKAMAAKGSAAKIALAVSAAPPEISRDASVAELTPDGKLNVIREGTNGWLCLADQPSTPLPDPGCFDKTWQDLFTAMMAHKPFTPGAAGVSYMLRGGQTADNADPYKEKPDAGKQWMVEGPHLMLVVTNAAEIDGLPTEAGKGPYVMWKGSPYQHVMVPLK